MKQVNDSGLRAAARYPPCKEKGDKGVNFWVKIEARQHAMGSVSTHFCPLLLTQRIHIKLDLQLADGCHDKKKIRNKRRGEILQTRVLWVQLLVAVLLAHETKILGKGLCRKGREASA